MVAAHAAVSVCPHCNRRVRSGVEIHAAAADLEALVAGVAPLARSDSSPDRELHDALACLIRHYTLEMRAELAGEHLNCVATGVDQDLVDVALSRAAACAARERESVQ